MKKNLFNLIDEPWIPISGIGAVSLRRVFSNPQCRSLAGNPVQKIALTKFLLAIAQSAYTAKNDDEWHAIEPAFLAEKCLDYLMQWHDQFYLYGETPFLQMTSICKVREQTIGSVMLEIATGNTKFLRQSQQESMLDEAEKALLLIQSMSFGFSGKSDNSITLTKGYKEKTNPKGKAAAGQHGPALGRQGLLHSFVEGETLLQTLLFNLMTAEQIDRFFPESLGVAPWEEMPEGEDCLAAKRLKASYMGRLVPLAQFILLHDNTMRCSDGIKHLDFHDDAFDLSCCIKLKGKEKKALWCDTKKDPFFKIPDLLESCFNEDSTFACPSLKNISRLAGGQQIFSIWSGGVQVNWKAGKQYMSRDDDYVESSVTLKAPDLDEAWFEKLQQKFNAVRKVASIVYSCILSFYKDCSGAEVPEKAQLGAETFLKLCSQKKQLFIDSLSDEKKMSLFKKACINFAEQAYSEFCSNVTPRQMLAYCKNQPKYLDRTI